jgi:hypothetical protein
MMKASYPVGISQEDEGFLLTPVKRMKPEGVILTDRQFFPTGTFFWQRLL